MKRISVEDVVEAYAKTGLKPGRTLFKATDGRICGLGVVGEANGLNHSRMYREFEDRLGISVNYCSGFWRGFDGLQIYECRCEEMRAGFADGSAAARAVFGEAKS